MDNLDGLIERARKLDTHALSKLVENFYPNIYRYFFYRVEVKEDAEDLTSEVFVRLVGSIKKQRRNFTAWIFSIARNLLIDYYRKKGRRREVPLDEATLDLKASLSVKSVDLTEDDLKKILKVLTGEQQEVITLKFIEGYSNDEISRIMKKSVGAIKALQFRALATLREIFKKETWLKDGKAI